MARHDRLTVLTTMIDGGLVPLFYNNDVEVCRNVIHALAKGGARVIEFTNRGDQALEVFKVLVPYFAEAEPDLIMGVGSIADAPTAALAIINFTAGLWSSVSISSGTLSLFLTPKELRGV